MDTCHVCSDQIGKLLKDQSESDDKKDAQIEKLKDKIEMLSPPHYNKYHDYQKFKKSCADSCSNSVDETIRCIKCDLFCDTLTEDNDWGVLPLTVNIYDRTPDFSEIGYVNDDDCSSECDPNLCENKKRPYKPGTFIKDVFENDSETYESWWDLCEQWNEMVQDYNYEVGNPFSFFTNKTCFNCEQYYKKCHNCCYVTDKFFEKDGQYYCNKNCNDIQ